MENSPKLPVVALVVAVLAAIAAVVSYASRTREDVFVLNEVEIGLVSAAFALVIFGVQGLISILVEGRRLHPGLVAPRLTGPLSIGIVLLSLVLFGDSLALGYGIVDDWGAEGIGVLAGIGSLVLAVLLIFYKEAFVGDEARFDEREDGVPW